MPLETYEKKSRSEQDDLQHQMSLVIMPHLGKEASVAIKSSKVAVAIPAAPTVNKQWADVLPALTKSSSSIDLETRQFSITVVSQGIEDLERSDDVATALLSHSSSNDDSLDHELNPFGMEEPLDFTPEERVLHEHHMDFYEDLLNGALPGNKRKFGKKQMNDLVGNLLNYIREEEAKGGDSEYSRRRILHHAHTLYGLINHTLRQTESENARELLKELAKFVERVIKTYNDPASRIMNIIAGSFNIIGGVLGLLGPLGVGLEGIGIKAYGKMSNAPSWLQKTSGGLMKYFAPTSKMHSMDIPGVFGKVASGVGNINEVNKSGIEGRRTELNARIEEVKGFREDSKRKDESHKNREDQIKQAQDRKIQHESEMFQTIARG